MAIEEDLTTVVTEHYSGSSHSLHFEFRFQTGHMHFGIIDQLQCHENIRNNGLICLKMLVLAVYILVWMYAKQQGCEWNIFVLKNSLKIGFEFRFQSTPHVEPCLGSQKTPFWWAQLSEFFCDSCLDTYLYVCEISKHLS